MQQTKSFPSCGKFAFLKRSELVCISWSGVKVTEGQRSLLSVSKKLQRLQDVKVVGGSVVCQSSAMFKEEPLCLKRGAGRRGNPCR